MDNHPNTYDRRGLRRANSWSQGSGMIVRNRLAFVVAGVAVAAALMACAALMASWLMPVPRFVLSPGGQRIRPLDYPLLQSWGDRLRGRRYITLTFDDGPFGGDVDRQLLDILQKHHARAIFFVVCNRLPLVDDQLLRQEIEQGNLLGNHSFDHFRLPVLSQRRLQHEVGDCSDAIARRTHARPVYFRPPFGQTSPAVRGLVRACGMREMLWNANSEDSWLTRPQQILYWVNRESSNFSILLLHSRPTTAVALDRALSELEHRGFRFVLPERVPGQPATKSAI